MKVITAAENYEKQEGDILCFLAGGITKCPDWQSEVIKQLQKFYDTEHLVVFNPRRENFPIHDPNASYEQIKWEFEQLERMDIFSMYFAKSESVQPICMYELGRNLVRMEMRFPDDFKYRVIVGIESGYPRYNDVVIQTKLALDNECRVFHNQTPEFHAELIAGSYYELMMKTKGE